MYPRYSDDLIEQSDFVARNIYACEQAASKGKVGEANEYMTQQCIYDTVDKNPVNPETLEVWDNSDTDKQCPQEWFDRKIWDDAMCGDEKCGENFVYGDPVNWTKDSDVPARGYLPYLNADGTKTSCCSEPVPTIGLANCPGVFTFSDQIFADGANSTSVCAGARGFMSENWYDQDTSTNGVSGWTKINPIDSDSAAALKISNGNSDNPVKFLTAGQKVHVPYFLYANHKGAMAWYLSKKDCGSTANCFEVVDGETSNSNTAKILEFDDNSTFPTWNKTWRIMNMKYAAPHCGNNGEPGCAYGVAGETPGTTKDKHHDDVNSDPVPDPDVDDYSRVDDYVRLPADTEPGTYVLMARWDGATESSIFVNCADVQVVAGDGSDTNDDSDSDDTNADSGDSDDNHDNSDDGSDSGDDTDDNSDDNASDTDDNDNHNSHSDDDDDNHDDNSDDDHHSHDDNHGGDHSHDDNHDDNHGQDDNDHDNDGSGCGKQPEHRDKHKAPKDCSSKKGPSSDTTSSGWQHHKKPHKGKKSKSSQELLENL